MFIAVMTEKQIEEHFKNSLKEKGWIIDHPDVQDKVKRKVDEIMKEKQQPKCSGIRRELEKKRVCLGGICLPIRDY